MGQILKRPNLTTFAEALILIVGLSIIGTGLYFFAPGLRVSESKTVNYNEMNTDNIDNVITSPLLPLPSKTTSSKVLSQPRVRIGGYAWNGQTPIYVANGGAFTTKGSLMEGANINLELIKQDWLSELSNMQMKFIEEYDKGKEFPESNKAVFGVMIMGDGAPFYISSRQKSLDEKYGKGKYHLEVVGCMGMSNGEDKLIGKPEWKTNPKSMLGSLISVVAGDGDWVVLLNYCFANGLKVNPDFSTYDPDAVNIYPSADDDYMNSAKELIASQKEGFKVKLKVVKNGKLTGETIDKTVDGCATWTPGDKVVFDALTGYTDIVSTKEFKNQMATTLIVVKEWAEKHPDIVTNILKATLTASNQIKQYDEWQRRGAETVADGFKLENADYWYKMFKGQKGEKAGITYNMGGTRALNYADVMQYYGITDGIDRYKSVYNQVGTYLTELNPFGFNEAVGKVVPYEEAVNLFYLKNINDIDAGKVTKTDYSSNKSEVLASGEWHINFATGSAEILSSSDGDLEKLYNLLVQAEQTKITIFGHTDNTGSKEVNNSLSKMRANAVTDYLINKGISRDRIQDVGGKGDSEPISDNSTPVGRAKNRRVQITLLQ